jgi:hypothetical protein
MEVLMRSPLALILTLIALAPGSVAAQGGFWWSVGAGAARNRVSSGGFFGQVGLGLSRIRNSFDVGEESVRAAETGLNVSAGVGWDVPLGREIYLTPRVASVVVPVATIDTPAGPLDNVVSTIYRFELGLTFR